MHKIKFSVSFMFILLSITTWLISRHRDVSSKRLTTPDYYDLQTIIHKMYQREVDIYKNWPVQEVKDIQASIRGMAEEIVYQTFRNEELLHIPRNQVSNHLRAMGSMDEGTKIGNPDEFDFQVYFPHFTSRNIDIMWDNTSSYCATLKYLNDSHSHPKTSPFSKIVSGNMLTTNIVILFQQLAKPVIKTMYDNQFQYVMNSGKLIIAANESKYRYVCVTFYFQWESAVNDREPLVINVDLVPSVYISSRSISKILNPVTDKLSSILGLSDDMLTPPSQEAFTIGRQYNKYQFCLSFVKTQLNLMKVLTAEREDIVECFKVVKIFNPHRSPITSMDIKSLMIYEVLPKTEYSKYSMSECVFRLTERILELIKSKSCRQVLFPDLFFGYSNYRKLFKCRRNSQLYNVSQTFETVYNRLKGLISLHA